MEFGSEVCEFERGRGFIFFCVHNRSIHNEKPLAGSAWWRIVAG